MIVVNFLTQLPFNTKAKEEGAGIISYAGRRCVARSD